MGVWGGRMSEEKVEVSDGQNAHARLVLIQLQWLMTILLISAMLWLGSNQTRLAERVNSRLQVAEELNVRINDLDDRLFSVSQTAPAKPTMRNADNDWQLLFVQMSAVARLYEKGDYLAVGELLQGVRLQLMHSNLNIATPLKNALQQAIESDLRTLENLKNQPDAWQLHIIKMQEIQRFLKTQSTSDTELSRKELTQQNAQMLLTMAISATSLHEQQAMQHYLSEVKSQLAWLQQHQEPIVTNLSKKEKPSDLATTSYNHRVESLGEALYLVEELLENAPTSPELMSTKILKNNR